MIGSDLLLGHLDRITWFRITVYSLSKCYLATPIPSLCDEIVYISLDENRHDFKIKTSILVKFELGGKP